MEATSTPSSRRGQWCSGGEPDIGRDIVPATTTEGMRKVTHLTVNLTQIATSNAESNPSLALVYVPQGTNGRGTQHRNGRSNSRQHVRTQPVCHELRRGRPFSRSHQMSSPYLATSTTATRSLSSSVLLDGAATTVSLVVRYAITLN